MCQKGRQELATIIAKAKKRSSATGEGDNCRRERSSVDRNWAANPTHSFPPIVQCSKHLM
jgi:hypothetical protein